MEVDSMRRTSLTEQQLKFLKPYILHKRSKDKETTTNIKPNSQNSSNKIPKLREGFIKREKEPEPVDIAEQIDVLQKHLEKLKKEKHSLFQQLKLVLHDEDEKKKAEEHKLEYDKGSQSGDVFTVRPQRPFSSMLSSSYPGGSARQPRIPLLPTPEGTSGSFSRQNSAGSFFAGPEVFPQSKPILPPRVPTMPPLGRPPYVDKRLGPSYSGPGPIPADGVHMSAIHGNQAAQSPGTFTHMTTDMPPHHFPPGPNFPYTHGMSSFNVRAPGPPVSNPPVQMLYQGGSFIQSQDVQHFNQPMPPMHHMYGAVTSPHAPGGHTHGDHAPAPGITPIVHDPRHQKPPGAS